MSLPPLIALTLGDPTGIGPEICLRAIGEQEVRAAARLVLIGPAALRPEDVEEIDAQAVGRLRCELGAGEAVWISSEAPADWRMGEIQVEGGRAALAALRIGHELALAKHVDVLVTAPVCKEALHLAGEQVEGQTELLGNWCDVHDHQMLAIAGKLRVMLLTRHLPLRGALDLIDEERVLRHLQMLHDGLLDLGFSAPHLALAGLNPHAGENGLLGQEEAEILEPACARAQARGIHVTGPVSPDAVFANAAAGEYDGVLALYHDQAFIPIKLLGEGCGMTVLIGLPYLRMSPAHGVAFDLVGKGTARSSDLEVTIVQAARWARR
ncbi:MAG: 4-hydroxythreonine-4-phosphate dehydrogenase [Planctomycetota bacterium]|jgi:4-hydroxythreonine-4-phosphate dehydrogenase